jgi:hypothetical protein
MFYSNLTFDWGCAKCLGTEATYTNRCEQFRTLVPLGSSSKLYPDRTFQFRHCIVYNATHEKHVKIPHQFVTYFFNIIYRSP